MLVHGSCLISSLQHIYFDFGSLGSTQIRQLRGTFSVLFVQVTCQFTFIQVCRHKIFRSIFTLSEENVCFLLFYFQYYIIVIVIIASTKETLPNRVVPILSIMQVVCRPKSHRHNSIMNMTVHHAQRVSYPVPNAVNVPERE